MDINTVILSNGIQFMPKPRLRECFPCRFFEWILYQRDDTYYADGRSNPTRLGRYSLDSNNRTEAIKNLARLDLVKAVEHGLAERDELGSNRQAGPTIVEGWRLYMASIEMRQLTAGLSRNTFKRYRAVGDKFLSFCGREKVIYCRQITKRLLERYMAWLDGEGYAYATEYLEITTLKQLVAYLVDEAEIGGLKKIHLSMSKPTETDTYCYQPGEVEAIVEHCRTTAACKWLYGPLMTLACTGMRISELASLRWIDFDFNRGMIQLSDERHRAARRRTGNERVLKGRRSRSFPISSTLSPLLLELIRHPDGRVFHGPNGGKLKPDTVRRCLVRDVLTPLAARFPTPPGAVIGFVDGRLHSFRHFFCSFCANSPRVTEQMIMTWLGHNSSKMIRRYYHGNDRASQHAMQEVDFTALRKN